MGYDIHIVRTNCWLDASENPITKEQVEAVIGKDKELSWSYKDYVDMEDENEKVTRYFAINWNNTPCFLWHKDQIICSNASEEQVIKMVEISKALGAKVIGDDGETYDVKKNVFGKLSVIQNQP
jgi:hypothetical protein